MTTLLSSAPVHVSPQQQLRVAQDLFIRRWGEMGQTWGINRTMAEIHALLYICGSPLCTDDVMDRLNISRGNSSMSLRALCDWGIIRRLHKRGDDEPRQNATADFLRQSCGDDNELKCRYRIIVHNTEASRRYAALRSP